MGLVACKTHGMQSGPQCCAHVLEAAEAASAALDPATAVSFKLDLFSDGSMMMSFVLCGACALQFGRTSGEILPEQAFDDEKALPWTRPVCGGCLNRWIGSV